jgi:hypothetical protein
MKKRTSKLEGNVVKAMRALLQLESEIRTYFHFDSRFCKAFDKHVMAFKDLIFDLPTPDAHLYYPRGQGPVTWGEPHAYRTQYKQEPGTWKTIAYEPEHFYFEFNLLYSSELEDVEGGSRHYTLQVPVNLEDDECDDTEFQRRFDAWIEVKRAERKSKQTEKDTKALAELMKKYPDAAKSLIN